MTDVSGAAGQNQNFARIAVDPTITKAIRSASQQSGVSFELMMASARLESGFQPAAKAGTSSATGLFQFTDQTWLANVQRHGAQHGLTTEAAAVVDRGGRLTVANPADRNRILGLREDPTVASALAGDFLHDVSDSLRNSLGRAPTASEVYLGHFLGANGARQILTAPKDQIAANVLPDAADANQRMFYAADGTAFTTSQFLSHLSDKVSRAFSDIGATIPSDALAMADRAPSAAPPTTIAMAKGGASHSGIAPSHSKTAPERITLASLSKILSRDGGHTSLSSPDRSHHASDVPVGALTDLISST